ncbi:MAG: DUF488 domain-containing protein [Balneolaceae bacterium]
MNQSNFQIKRIYEAPSENDGYRVLIDRLWPRGVSKEAAQLDDWMKEITPSPELRKWFDHDPSKFEEFKMRYETELAEKNKPIESLLKIAADRNVSLLYAAKDETHNHAIVLKEFLEELL